MSKRNYDLSGLGAQSAGGQATNEAGDAIERPESPYTVGDVDVVSRLPIERAIHARPVHEEDVLVAAGQTDLQDAILSATGNENGVPNSMPFVGSAFRTGVKRDGSWIVVPTLTGVVLDSFVWLPNEDMSDSVMRPLVDVMKEFGFDVPKKNTKRDSRFDVPVLLLMNSWHPQKAKPEMAVADLGFNLTRRFEVGENTRTLSIDCRADRIFCKSDAIIAADQGETAPTMVRDYVAAQKALSYGLLLDMLDAEARTTGGERPRIQGEREKVRVVNVHLAQVYYGVSPIAKEKTFVTYHAVVRAINDPSSAGGAWQNVARDRKTAGLQSSFAVKL